MSTGSKNEVLQSIRSAVAGVAAPDAELNDSGDETIVRIDDRGNEVTLQCFVEMLHLTGGEAHILANDEAALSVLRSLLCEDRGSGVLMPADLELERQAVPRLVEEAGCKVLRREEVSLEEAAGAAVGITTAQAGIADTGTIVLFHSFERGRLAALLPPVHVAMLRRDRVYPDKASLLAGMRADNIDPGATPMTWVTGPSLTADIEKVLVRGAHGPRRLVVLLY